MMNEEPRPLPNRAGVRMAILLCGFLVLYSVSCSSDPLEPENRDAENAILAADRAYEAQRR